MEIIAILLIGIILILLYIIFLISKNNSVNKDNSEVCPPMQDTKQHVKNEQTHNTAQTQTKRRTQKMKWQNRMLDISMIPNSVELDKDTLLPQTLKRKYGYGKRFNAFVVSDDNCFHKSTCKNVKCKNKKLVHRYLAASHFYACEDCGPSSKIDDWYWKFLQTNFGKFTSYEEFQNYAELPPITGIAENYKPSLWGIQ